MLQNYIGLLKRSVTYSFSKEYYKKWWNVPLKDRFLYVGLPTSLTVPITMAIIRLQQGQYLFIAYLLIALFVGVPLLQMQVEKLIDKYN